MKIRIRLSAADMAHYRLLKHWKRKYEESLLRGQFGFKYLLSQDSIYWENIELYEKVSAQIAVLRTRGLAQ